MQRVESQHRFGTAVFVAVLVAAAAASLPLEGQAQIAAIGGAFSGVGTGEGIYQSAPIVVESGYVLEQGQWTTGSYLLQGFISLDDQPILITDLWGKPIAFDVVDVDITSTQFLVGGFYGATEKLTLGLFAYPHIGFDTEFSSRYYDIMDASASGFGDIVLYSKYQLWRSVNNRSCISGIGALALPTGDEEVGAGNTSLGLGLAGSHQMDRWSLHGETSLEIPSEDEADPVFTIAGAAVHASQSRLGFSIEALGRASGGDFALDLAPGARFRASRRVYIDTALSFNVTGPDYAQFDYLFIAGVNVLW